MGKLKGKVVTAGDKGMLRYKDESGNKIEIPFTQQYQRELGIEVDGTVKFDLITVNGKGMGVAVEAVDKGEVTLIEGSKGTIVEKDSGKVYTFEQNFLKESGIEKGSQVTFKFVMANGTLVATCVSLCGD